MIKVEIGILAPDRHTVVWPPDFRTYAPPDRLHEAMAHVLKLAGRDVAAIRTIKEES
jgi:hypothetical protein